MENAGEVTRKEPGRQLQDGPVAVSSPCLVVLRAMADLPGAAAIVLNQRPALLQLSQGALAIRDAGQDREHQVGLELPGHVLGRYNIPGRCLFKLNP